MVILEKNVDIKSMLCYNSITGVEKTLVIWGISSAGRAPRLHRGGQRFDPAMLHHMLINVEKSTLLFCLDNYFEKNYFIVVFFC